MRHFFVTAAAAAGFFVFANAVSAEPAAVQTASLGAAAASSASAAPEQPPERPKELSSVEVVVDVSEQKLTLSLNGAAYRTWDVSTGQKVHWTPTGVFKPQFLSRHHRSSRYNNAPMPYSVFFNGNIAIHGTTHLKRLGSRASKGCVRLHPKNAAVLFALVKEVGKKQTVIRVVD